MIIPNYLCICSKVLNLCDEVNVTVLKRINVAKGGNKTQLEQYHGDMLCC